MIRERKDPNRRPCFPASEVPESVWREVFERVPPLTLQQAADVIGCAPMTIHKYRKKLGYESPYKPGGQKFTKWTLADAKRIADTRKPGEALTDAAHRAGYDYTAAKTIYRKFRHYFNERLR